MWPNRISLPSFPWWAGGERGDLASGHRGRTSRSPRICPAPLGTLSTWPRILGQLFFKKMAAPEDLPGGDPSAIWGCKSDLPQVDRRSDPGHLERLPFGAHSNGLRGKICHQTPSRHMTHLPSALEGHELEVKGVSSSKVHLAPPRSLAQPGYHHDPVACSSFPSRMFTTAANESPIVIASLYPLYPRISAWALDSVQNACCLDSHWTGSPP